MQNNNRNKNTEKDFYQATLFDKNQEIERCDYNLPFLEKFIPGDKTARILDAGCGNGKYANYFYEKGYHNLVAVDLFDSIVNEEVPYQAASIENLPFKNNEFDVIYSNSVIYHLEKPENALIEFNRILKKGGILIFSGHTKYSLHTIWRKIKLSLKCKSVDNLKSAKFYSTCKYLKILRSNQFKIIHTDGFHLSLIFYPYYRRKIKWFEIHYKLKLPLIKPKVSRFKFAGRLKAAFAYHFVIVSMKEELK